MRWVLFLSVAWLQAAAVITLDTQANAKLATSNANESTMIAKLQESLQLYGQLITHAQAKLAKLNQLQGLLERAEEFTHARTLPPRDSMLASLHDQIAQLQKYQAHLNTLTKRYRTLVQHKRMRLESQCPWLDFERGVIVQHSSQEAQEAQAFLNTLQENPDHAMLDGSVLATLLCEYSLKTRTRHTHRTQVQEMQTALLDGDFKRYHTLQQGYTQARLESENAQSKHTQAILATLTKRTEQIRQFLAPATLQTRLYALNNTLKTQLQGAKDSNAQARAYSQYRQQAQALQLELLLELTRQLHFLNETMAMNTALMSHTIARSNTLNFKLNAYGFPELGTP
ncbi:hypothetical protein ACFOPX_00215 [Helicobacter baculiformis]|uniref:Uncharacterized protein n=1 Tax=Helicobacter baculiformis TaxID=427351 RepID=A0ABV7ZHJ6_9HELI|nr:hypothetical protein [Helicobacter baculiformis]